MKALSKKAYGVLSAWIICTGIHVSAFAGWLEFPSDQAAQMYFIAWVGCANAAFTLAIKSSRLALAVLVSGWAVALALCVPSIGVFPASFGVSFGIMLLTTVAMVDNTFVHLAAYGGVGRISAEKSRYKTSSSERIKKGNLKNIGAEEWGRATSRRKSILGDFTSVTQSEAAFNRAANINAIHHLSDEF
tara:strand:- start:503 stop:1069 length:567 start_codon:yes stop_codon:yes gene_type:complete